MNGTCMCPAGYTGPSCIDYVCECFATAIMHVVKSEQCIVIVEHLYLLLQVIHHVEMVVTVHTTTPAIVIMDSVVHVVR